MLKTGKKVGSTRIFSEDLKRKLVNDFEKGLITVSQISRIYDVSITAIYKWIYKYSNYNERNVLVVEMKDSQTKKLKELEDKVKDLERVVGQKQIMIDYLENLIDLAKETYSIDIKKNSNTPHSGGSNPNKKP